MLFNIQSIGVHRNYKKRIGFIYLTLTNSKTLLLFRNNLFTKTK